MFSKIVQTHVSTIFCLWILNEEISCLIFICSFCLSVSMRISKAMYVPFEFQRIWFFLKKILTRLTFTSAAASGTLKLKLINRKFSFIIFRKIYLQNTSIGIFFSSSFTRSISVHTVSASSGTPLSGL